MSLSTLFRLVILGTQFFLTTPFKDEDGNPHFIQEHPQNRASILQAAGGLVHPNFAHFLFPHPNIMISSTQHGICENNKCLG